MVEMDDNFKLLYFISKQLSTLRKHAPWADDQRVGGKLKQLKMDMEFLHTFFRSFDKSWDEESRIRIRCTITSFRVLWEVKRNGLVQKSLKDTWPLDVQAFLSLAFDLEGKIQQTKLLLQQLCEYLYSSSTQLSEGYYPYHLVSILDKIFSYTAVKIVPFKNQIEILKDKVAFMELLSKHLNGNLEKYIGDFIKNAMCIAILYWAKGADEEVATVLLYDMSYKFIPYAPEFSFLISQKRLNFDTLLAIVASFFDFFFKHLDQDEDFLILGDPLTLVFISLSNTPHESVETEEEVLRSQMFAIFYEQVLSFCEMKQVFSNTRMLLMTQIERANAEIRELYYGRFSDSCISLEAEKLDYVYFVSISKELYLIEKYWIEKYWIEKSERRQLNLYRIELRFLRVFFLCFATWDNKEIKERLSSMIELYV